LSSLSLSLSLSLCSEAHRKGKWDPEVIIIVALLAIFFFLFRNKLVCISLDFAEYLLGVQAHIAQSMHHVQLSSSDGIPMKLHMIQWMIRRAKKADKVRERDIDASVSLSLSL
jgi:hypothetical protein